MSYLAAAEDLRPNPGQWAAYESHGSVAMLAGPGSGKTKTLTVKLARVLAEEIPTWQGAACITYNNECARELEVRLHALGVRTGRRMFIGTVHAFCLAHILTPFLHLTGPAETHAEFRVAGDRQRLTILQTAMDSVLPDSQDAASYMFTLGLGRRTYHKDLSEWAARDPYAAQVFAQYWAALRLAGYVDFDGIVQLSLEILREHEWAPRVLASRFPVVAIDEYQDLGGPLHSLVQVLLDAARVRIIAVGDPDQSIYGFQGAQPAMLHELAARVDFQRIPLTLNYRSIREIVVASEAVLGEPRGYTWVSDETGAVNVVGCNGGLEGQAAVLFDDLLPEILVKRTGRRLGDVAVLYADRYAGGVVAAAAEAMEVKYLRADAGAPFRRSPFVRWLQDCAAWCSGGWHMGEPNLGDLLDWWVAHVAPGASEIAQTESRVSLTEFLVARRTREPVEMTDWLNLFNDLVFASAIFGHPEFDTYHDDLDAVCAAAVEPPRLTVQEFGGQSAEERDRLNLMTLHSAKGLEFDVVIMVGMDEGTLPRTNASDPQLREARRLFYVGMTRAKRELYALYSAHSRGSGARGPSRFLSDLAGSLPP